MDKTPKIMKSLRLNKQHMTYKEPSSTNSNSFQTPKKLDVDNDTDSPMFLPCTQDGSEEIAVGWDWNSPQSKQKQTKVIKQKRLALSQSPKIPIKRHPSSGATQNFDKLREQLQALKHEIAVPDDEDSLCISPLDEAAFKEQSNENNLNTLIQNDDHINFEQEMEDIFNDSFDDQLFAYTQQVETVLAKNTTKKTTNISFQGSLDAFKFEDDDFTALTQVLDVSQLEKKILNTSNVNIPSTSSNKSQFGTVRTNLFSSPTRIQRTVSDDVQLNGTTKLKKCKTEIPRTQSFEMPSAAQLSSNLPKSISEEIERRRLEALAKLQAKKLNSTAAITTGSLSANTSPIKCSPDEIEKKRRYAMAKLQAKKQEELDQKRRAQEIEMKRLQSEEMERKRLQIEENERKKQLEEKNRLQELALLQLKKEAEKFAQKQLEAKNAAEEIEQNRLQALAKLEAKKVQEQKRIQEEITRKRLEALAKLKAKIAAENEQKQNNTKLNFNETKPAFKFEQKSFEMTVKSEVIVNQSLKASQGSQLDSKQLQEIERKRLEALRKLEMNRTKKVTAHSSFR